ncbi:MAG: glycosyltransferase [Candidatus Nanopelagicales bacterium]
MDQSKVRLSDIRESQAAINDYWSSRAREAAVLSSEVVALRAEVQATQQQLAQLQSRKITRAANLISRVRHRGAAQQAAPVPLPPSGPLFSVMVTVYNNGGDLPRALDSVRSQTLPDWEILVWDDGSTDPQTLTALSEVEAENIRAFRGENQGVIGARNSVAAHARGEFLLFLDPDDRLEATYLEKALITFTRFPTVDLVVPTTRVLSDSAEPYWYPAHFVEERIAYENTAPISTVMRRKVWDTVGGMHAEFGAGFEDWGFWRAAAADGCRGWVLDDALFTYTHSLTTGRDATARKQRDALELLIKQRNPVISHPAGPIDPAPGAVTRMLEQRVFHMPNDGRSSLVVFVPWLIKGGGAETFLKTLLTGLADERHIVIITTQAPPADHELNGNAFLEITPYVYQLPALVEPSDFAALVSSILYRLVEPDILQVGSPWAYEHMHLLKGWSRGWGTTVDVQFNHVGHLAELLQVTPYVDEVLVTHGRLKALLEQVYQVTPPVSVLHIAPPIVSADLPELPPRPVDRRLRIGWLGRNSPEKRPDLVLDIAAMAPGIDFVVAGSGFGERPPATTDNVEIVGWVGDTRAFIRNCDLLLNTSDTEGISVSAMEALALGVPVATRDVGGMPELICDGDNGLVYDVDHLPDLILRLQDTELVEGLRKHVAAEGLPGQFTASHMIETVKAHLARPRGSSAPEVGQQPS